MKKIFFLSLCLLIFVAPANAFKKKSGKNKAQVFLKDSFLLEKNIVLDGELYALRIGYALVPNSDEMIISTVYDELLQKPINNILWQTTEIKASKIPPKSYTPHKIEQVILKQMEEMAQTLDPNLAYDRFINDKHLIQKKFFFKKSEIFDMSKPLQEKKQILEINFLAKNANLKFPLDISELIYFKQSPAPKTPSPQKPKASKAQASQFNPNGGNAKVPRYLFPQSKSVDSNTAPRQPSQEELSQELELKELEEVKMKVQGMDQFYQTQFQPEKQADENIPNNLQMLMREAEDSSSEEQDLF